MKKVALWILGVIGGLILITICVLFTPPGNAIVKSIAQGQIDKYSPIKLDIQTFSLGFSSINVSIAHSDKILITLDGDFSLFSQMIDMILKVDAKDISVLGELAGTPLNGSFIVKTTAKGTLNHLEVNTTSDIAKSITDIRVLLQDYSPASVIANIKDMQINEILAIAGIKPYASGMLNIEADIKGDADMNFNGNALLNLTQGLVDSKLIKEDFEVDVPKTTFVITLNTLFDMDKLKHDLSFNSNIGNIHSAGQTSLKELNTNTTYSINLSDLSAFTPLVGMPIRGNLNTKGEAIGDMESLDIKGSSDIATSATIYEATLKQLAPHSAELHVKNLRLDTLLWMIYMPRYATMNLNLDSIISDFDKGISTNTTLTLSGTTNNEVMRKEMDLDMPNTSFTLKSKIDIAEGVGEANSSVDSSIAQAKLTKTQINLNNIAFEAPYELNIPNLKKLKFATGIELAGSFSATGKAKLAQALYADFNTTSLGGNINAILNDNKLTASLKNVNTLKLLSMLQLPEVFSSAMNGDFAYDTETEKGTLKAVLSNGKLMPNKVTEIAEKYLKTDITKEAYEDAGLNANIDKKIITADIGLKSNNTAIYSKGANINTDKGTINTDIKFQIKDKAIAIKVRNQLSSPSISIDAGDLIKEEATKALSKGAKDAVDKYIKDDRVKEGAQKLLNNLFK